MFAKLRKYLQVKTINDLPPLPSGSPDLITICFNPHQSVNGEYRYGLVAPPYRIEECQVDSCRRQLADASAVFLYRDLETGLLVMICEDCSLAAEICQPERFKLIML